MLTDRAKEHIRNLSDQDLAEYLAAGEQMYEPAAVEFARGEFARRNLDDAEVSRLASVAAARVAAENAARDSLAAVPLAWDGKLLAFVVGIFGLATLPVVFRYWVQMDIRGESLKASQTKRFFLYGLAVGFSAIILFAAPETAFHGIHLWERYLGH